MAQRLVALVLLGTVLVGCLSDDSEPLSTLPGFATEVIFIDRQDLLVAVADTAPSRGRGLMGVTDLGDLDGMLFVFEADTDTGFWMKDTLIPLDIAFFTAEGGFVDRLVMEPCIADPCPSYQAAGPYRFALEAPAGALEFVGPGSVLEIDS